jgi:hypothetical protein
MKTRYVKFGKEFFNVKNKPLPKGAWWYWFCLFFIDNPKNPKKPRQLMITWSSRNEKEFKINQLQLKGYRPKDGGTLDGGIGSWYFDGRKMHHNYLLEHCSIDVTMKTLRSCSTFFKAGNKRSSIKVGNDFELTAEPTGSRDTTYFTMKGYSLVEAKHFRLSGTLKGESISGTAYLQRVIYTLPYPSWYWGIFHFKNGADLIYFRVFILRRLLGEGISFFDGRKMHNFKNAEVEMRGDEKPVFRIRGQSRREKISFTVRAYSKTSWTFKKKYAGIIPNKLVYNEYPAVISSFKLADKKRRKVLLRDLGSSVGNAEYGTGLLM